MNLTPIAGLNYCTNHLAMPHPILITSHTSHLSTQSHISYATPSLATPHPSTRSYSTILLATPHPLILNIMKNTLFTMIFFAGPF